MLFKKPYKSRFFTSGLPCSLDFHAHLGVTFLRKIILLLLDTSNKTQQTQSMKQTNNPDEVLLTWVGNFPFPSQTGLVNSIIHSYTTVYFSYLELTTIVINYVFEYLMSVPVNYKHYEIKDHSIRLSHHSIFSTWYSMPDYSKHLLNTCGMKCIANLKKKKSTHQKWQKYKNK